MYIITELQQVQQNLTPGAPLFFDTETIGLYGRIRLAQFYQTGWADVMLVENPNPFELAVLLSKVHLVMHNGHYDITTIQAQSNTRWVPDNWDDTFFLSRLFYYSQESFSLDDCLRYALGYDPYEKQGLDKKAMQKSNWEALVLTNDQLTYAAIDVGHLPTLFNIVKEADGTTSYKLDMLTTKYCLDFQNNGMPVDTKRLQAKYKANLAAIEEEALPINVNSYQQVRPYIGSNDSDDLGLSHLAIKGNERAAKVQKVRKLRKENSFLDKFDTTEQRIYGKFLPSTRSGRLASKDQNLQQLPRSTKGVFGVSTESDKVLVYSDYAQLELRCACVITGEERMEKLMRGGGDLHGYAAEMLFGKDFTKAQRQIAKTANFNLLYGGGHNMLGSILVKTAKVWLPEEELRAIKKKWLNLWPTLSKWQQQGISDYRNGRPGSTPLGRRYKAAMMTDQLNIQVQGFGAEIAKLALHYMYDKLKELPDTHLINFIHDSYIVECPRDEEVYVKASSIIADAMQEAWREGTKAAKIKDLPMPVEVKVGYNWGDIEKDDIIYKLEI